MTVFRDADMNFSRKRRECNSCHGFFFSKSRVEDDRKADEKNCERPQIVLRDDGIHFSLNRYHVCYGAKNRYECTNVRHRV